jgi:sulfite reductase beta subunit-like hemoprotein
MNVEDNIGMNLKRKPVFPCIKKPEEPIACRLIGLYPQRQEGLWMQRIKILGGMLTREQWLGIAHLCRSITPSASLHLTTRQDIEFHNLTAERIPLVQSEMAATGLTGIGACGDTLRNITLCYGNGLCQDTPDLTNAAWAVRRVLEDYAEIFTLPRKFKISFSGCTKACAQPWINDLAFVAKKQNGPVTMQVIGAGSLGPHPGTGILLEDNLPVQQVPVFALAAIHLFNTHGERMIRRKARLRHVRQRMGDQEFIQMLKQEFEKCQRANVPGIPPIRLSEDRYTYLGALRFPYGSMEPSDAETLADLLQGENLVARLQNHHSVALFAQNTDEALKNISAISNFKKLFSGLNIISCPGSTYCRLAIVNTHRAEKVLRNSLPDSERRAICISGCPNNCAQSAVAEIGLVGRLRKGKNGNRIEGFQILKNGGMGQNAVLSESVIPFVATDNLPEALPPCD